MVGGAGQELCFYTAQQLSWDTILCCLLERDSTSAGDGGGNLHSLSSLFSLCNSDVKCKENIFPKRWESWIMVLFVPCMPSFVLFSHSSPCQLDLDPGRRAVTCTETRSFLLSRLLLMNDLLFCLNISEYPLLKMHSVQEGSRKQC